MTGWHIRLAQPEDAEAMSAVEEDAAALFASDPSLAGIALPPAGTPEDYRTRIAQGHCIVAHEGERIVGFASCRPVGRELHLHELSVASSHQGRGIGRRLLYAVVADARASGFRAVTLNTFRDVAWNGPFYARHGFVEIDDIESHPRLAASLEAAVAAGLPRERRCAMIRFV